MKRRTARLAALGLSAFFIAGTVSFPVHAAEVPEDSGSSVFASKNSSSEEPKTDGPELEETEATEEPKVSEDVPAKAETNDNVPEAVEGTVDEAPAVEAQTVSESTDDLEAASEEAQDESNTAAADVPVNPQDFDFDGAAATIDNAVVTTGDAKDAAAGASEQTDNAVVVINKEETTSDEATLVIENAEATVEEAKATFDQAESNYNDALNAYNQAVSAYNAILDDYNNQKEMTAAELEEAEAALTEAMDAVDDLEAELKARKVELIEAGATSLISIRNGANGGRGGTNAIAMDQYISTVVEYYYIPETEQLSDGQSVSNFCMYSADEDGYVTVEYDVIDEDGETIRTGAAEYKFEIDDETGEVKVSTREKVYHYTNKNGEEVYISKDDAEKLAPENMIEIAKYYSTSGRYVLRHVDSVAFHKEYEGNMETYNSIDPITISDCHEYWENIYKTPRADEELYSVHAVFNSGTKTFDRTRYVVVVNSSYDVYYNIVGEYKDIPEHIANAQYSSYQEAYEALSRYAISSGKGISGIDEMASDDTLDISEKHEYSEVVSEYENRDFSDAFSEMVNSYYNLLNTVTVAKTRMLSVNNRLSTLRTQMATIEENYTEVVNTSAIVTSFEINLEKAENNYVEASDNLTFAEEKLEEAKEAFEERFGIKEEEETIPEPIIEEEELEEVPVQPVITSSGESESSEEVVEELEEELEEIEEEPVPAAYLGSTSHVSGADHGIAEKVDEIIQDIDEAPVEQQPTQAPATPKAKEEKPEAITFKGILERGKWFVGLAGVSSAGAGVAAFEAKRRAAIKLLDKLNQ